MDASAASFALRSLSPCHRARLVEHDRQVDGGSSSVSLMGRPVNPTLEITRLFLTGH